MFIYHRPDSLASVTEAQLIPLNQTIRQQWPVAWRDLFFAHERASVDELILRRQTAKLSGQPDPTALMMASVGGIVCAALHALKVGDISISTAPAFSRSTYVISSNSAVNGAVLAALAAHAKGARKVGIIESRTSSVPDIIEKLGIDWVTHVVDHELSAQSIKKKFYDCELLIYVVSTTYNPDVAVACREARLPLAVALGGKREGLAAWHLSIISSLLLAECISAA